MSRQFSKESKKHQRTMEIWQHASMAEAVAYGLESYQHLTDRKTPRSKMEQVICPEAMNSDPARLARALVKADELAEAALAADPRLARRAVWRRGEEGDIACPALIAQGDDTPCFYRERRTLTEANGGAPVRVVISTDSGVFGETPAAFIAAVRLVQQWRSVEVWWQGAWLNHNATAGWVFHVPLVAGDMDFARLDFCLASNHRDELSFAQVVTQNARVDGSGSTPYGQATKSYLPELPGQQECDHFVRHTGITPDGASIARHAAEWLGWAAVAPVEEVVAPTLGWGNGTHQTEQEAAAAKAKSMCKVY